MILEKRLKSNDTVDKYIDKIIHDDSFVAPESNTSFIKASDIINSLGVEFNKAPVKEYAEALSIWTCLSIDEVYKMREDMYVKSDEPYYIVVEKHMVFESVLRVGEKLVKSKNSNNLVSKGMTRFIDEHGECINILNINIEKYLKEIN